jgi:spore germination protein YaaH
MKSFNIRKFLALLTALMMLVGISGISYAKVRKNLPPATPTNVTATALSSSEIAISWTSVTDASGYKLYVATSYNSNFTLLVTTTSTSYKQVNLKAATTYWYYVVAYNNYGTSGSSTHVSTITMPVPVPTPTPTLTPTPTPIPTPTPTPGSSKYFLGFSTYYYAGDSSSYNSMINNTPAINQIATDTFSTDGLGTITGLVPTQQLTYANANGIKTSAMITNNFDGNIAKTLLESSINRQALINHILDAITANGYNGVNVDLEGIYAADRGYFTLFVSELYNKLHPLGYEVSVCVPAKTADNSAYTWNYAYDYASLADYSDRIVIMAYDEHYPGGTAGPVASIGWVQNVANYAVTVVPKEKLLLGIAAYGYDWSVNGTKAYSINGIYSVAAANNATIQWDAISKSPFFSYTDTSGISHTVWFENNTSIGYKLDIINNMNLSGAAMWRLGLENSDYWTTVKTKLNK